MNERNHTPLPWHLQPIGGELYTEANARLMAAAPDLMHALQECLACLVSDSDSEEQYAIEIKQARAAINSAESGDVK